MDSSNVTLDSGRVVLIVVGCNLVVAIAGFYLAWRLWRLRPQLVRLTRTLDDYERQARLLPWFTAQLLASQLGLMQTRWQYQTAQTQWQHWHHRLRLMRRIWRYGQRWRR